MGSVGTSSSEWRYPDFLLSEKAVTGVKGGKRGKGTGITGDGAGNKVEKSRL